MKKKQFFTVEYSNLNSVQGDIAVLQSSSNFQRVGSGSSKPRPDELDIKPFVNERPLPVPTPSREAMLTQKLEVNIIDYI